MELNDYLLEKFRRWQPSAPQVVERNKGDITLDWRQERFAFVEDQLLYRVEKNNRLPKWVVVYSGGKTTKLIDNLAPRHPHRFRVKVLLKAGGVAGLAARALRRLGDEGSVREAFAEDDNVNKDDSTNEVTSKEESKAVEADNSVSRAPRWAESCWSEETWTSTDTDGTSAVCFCMAVKCGYIKQIQAMLEERPELLGIPNSNNGFTPLATAVRKGDLNIVRFLLSAGAALEQRSAAGQSPLQLAALAGDLPLAELLLDAGALIQARDWNGLRAEHYAADSGCADMLRLVLDRGGDVHATDYNGWTPLFRALCQGAKTEIIQELVVRGSDVDAVDLAGLPLTSVARLLKNRHGRPRESVLRLVDTNYPHEKALANFTRVSKKIHHLHTMLNLT